MWNAAFKKFEAIWSAKTDHITSNFIKTVTHNLVHSWPIANVHPFYCHQKMWKMNICNGCGGNRGIIPTDVLKEIFCKSFGKFIFKRLGMSPYLLKLQVYIACNLTESCFPESFMNFFRVAYLQNICEWLRAIQRYIQIPDKHQRGSIFCKSN